VERALFCAIADGVGRATNGHASDDLPVAVRSWPAAIGPPRLNVLSIAGRGETPSGNEMLGSAAKWTGKFIAAEFAVALANRHLRRRQWQGHRRQALSAQQIFADGIEMPLTLDC